VRVLGGSPKRRSAGPPLLTSVASSKKSRARNRRSLGPHLLVKTGRQRSRPKPPDRRRAAPIHYVVSKLVETDSKRTIRWLIALMLARHRIDCGGFDAAIHCLKPHLVRSTFESCPADAIEESGFKSASHPDRALTVRKVRTLSDLDNITVRIADVAANLAVFGYRLRDELGSSTAP
jgi:hypothetical protein